MAYTSEASVLLRAPAISAAVSSSEQVAAGIVVAEARINGKLAEKFDIPFSDPVPDLVQVVATTLAASWAMRNVYSGADHIEQQAFAARLEQEGAAMLEEIRLGNMLLGDAATKATIKSRTVPIYVSGSRVSEQIRDIDMLGHRGPKRPDNHFSRERGYPW